MASSGAAIIHRREGDRPGHGGVANAGNRDDLNAPALELRASVLEAAVSLGFRNSVMKKWMFEPVPEGDDDEHGTPALTSPSTTSEESAMSPASFLHPTTSASTSASAYPYSRANNLNPGSSSGIGVANPNTNFPGAGMGMRFSHDDDMMSANGSQKGPFGMFALAAPPSKNKLRKQKSALPVIGAVGGLNGYDSDGGYASETSKKPKTKKSLAWRRYVDGDGDDSDAGYRSEAVSGFAVSKAKSRRKAKGVEGENIYIPRPRDAPSPMLPPMNLNSDPGALLATIKASALSGSSSPSDSGLGSRTPEPIRNGSTRAFTSSSDNGHGPVGSKLATSVVATDGYLTDSGSTEKRGRSKKKAKSGKSSSKSRPTSPEGDDSRAPTKKKSFFRRVGRSVSRDAKDRDRSRANEVVPPMPEPPKLPVSLPIAEKFTRSGAGTPVGNASASSSSTSGSISSSKYTDAQAEHRSSGSLSTLVPPTRRDPTISRSESPWSYKSAPGRFEAGPESIDADRGGSSSNSNSLDLPRERRNSAGWSPFVVIPRDRTDSEVNTNETNGRAGGGRDRRDAERAASPILTRSVSPIATSSANQSNSPSSPDVTRSPTKRIGKLFSAFGQSSKSDDGHSNDSHASFGSSSNGAAPPASFSSSKPAISGPNPHVRRGSLSLKFPSPMEIAAALTSSSRGNANGSGSTSNNSNGDAKNLAVPGEGVPVKTPESFIIIDEDEGVPTPMKQQRFAESNANSGDPSSSSSPYPTATLGSGAGDPPSLPRPNGAGIGLSARRRALLNGLGIDTTPTQSRSGTPTPVNTYASPTDGIPTEEEVRAARASVLAYYNVPPPSPPPTGPLPAPPQLTPSSPSTGLRPVSPSQELGGNRQALLSPGRAFASRSPSPLGLSPNFNQDNRFSSRSPSPGLGVGQGVRRGRESPFPTRPVLPPQNRQELVERVERFKVLYAAAEGSGSDENAGAGKERDEELLDKHSSAYIRQARARGEKRVYFEPKHYSIRDTYYYGDTFEDDSEEYGEGFHYGEGYPKDIDLENEDDVDGVDPVIPNINVHPDPEAEKEGLVYEDDFDEQADERLRLSRLSTRDEFEDADPSANESVLSDSVTPVRAVDGLGDENSSTDRRSYATSSVYSEHSVLDADKSAKLREGLVRRVAAMYNGKSGGKDEGRLLREEIPAVPKLPKEFRNVNVAAAAGQLGRNELKATSSPYRF